MNKNTSAKIFSIISAVCFIIVTALNILIVVSNVDVTFITIIPWVTWVAYAVLLFLQKKNIILVIVGVADVLLNLYYFIDCCLHYFYFRVFLCAVLDLLCAVFILIIILFNCLPSLQGKRKVVSRLWFLPGVFIAVVILIMWVEWVFYYSVAFAYISIVISIIEASAYIMLGLWLYRSPEIKGNTKATSVNEYATFNPQNINVSPPVSSAIGGADKLKEFKELLDMGVITQEEYDVKKKQILACDTEINEALAQTLPISDSPNNENFSEENQNSTSDDYLEQSSDLENMNDAYVCTNCGTALEEVQAFCPKCGTPKAVIKNSFCPKCGAELQVGQEFCSTCGQKVSFEASSVKKKSKKTIIIPIVIIAVVAIVALVFFLLLKTPSVDFASVYDEYCDSSWASLASDGSYLSIDTNPDDEDDYVSFSAYYALSSINEALGLPDSLFEKMGETRALDGRQIETYDNITVSWKYHPDYGLEVIYEAR